MRGKENGEENGKEERKEKGNHTRKQMTNQFKWHILDFKAKEFDFFSKLKILSKYVKMSTALKTIRVVH